MGIMKQSTASSSSAGIAVDSVESKAIDDVAVIEERNDVVAVIETLTEELPRFRGTSNLLQYYS